VLTASRKDDIGTPAQHEDDQTLIAGSDAGLPVTIEPSTLDDLKEALVEIGFSREAAATVASKVQDQLQL
jgi:hypothetical protein